MDKDKKTGYVKGVGNTSQKSPSKLNTLKKFKDKQKLLDKQKNITKSTGNINRKNKMDLMKLKRKNKLKILAKKKILNKR